MENLLDLQGNIKKLTQDEIKQFLQMITNQETSNPEQILKTFPQLDIENLDEDTLASLRIAIFNIIADGKDIFPRPKQDRSGVMRMDAPEPWPDPPDKG